MGVAVAVTPVTVAPTGSAAALIVTVPDLLESCTLVARMTVVLAVFRLSAVNVTFAPVVFESVPVPLTMLQFTASLNPFAPVTVALSAVLAPASSVLLAALTVTAVMVGVGVGGGLLHATNAVRTIMATMARNRFIHNCLLNTNQRLAWNAILSLG